jgi:hypothetical protein
VTEDKWGPVDELEFWGRTDGDRNTNDLGLARYDRRGRLDPTFGGDGRVATEFLPGGYEEAAAVLPGPRHTVVAVGTAFPPSGTDPRLALARYLPDGRLDPAFGEGGLARVSFGDGGRAATCPRTGLRERGSGGG